MATLDDPSTWPQWGIPDAQTIKMIEEEDVRVFPPVGLDSLPKLREAWSETIGNDAAEVLQAAGSEVVSDEIHVPLRDGTTSRTLLFKPSAKPADGSALVVLIHGGGFLIGTPEMEVPACVNAVKAYGCVCLSVGYRLAPESKYPTPYEDCWDVLQWTRSHAAELGADLSKGFVLGGTSAGGRMTGTLALWARDSNMQPPLTGLYLNATSLAYADAIPGPYRHLYRSHVEAEAREGRRAQKSKDTFEKALDPDIHSEVWNPLGWPTDHHGLPRTYLQVCGTDYHRDEALIFERILRLEHQIDTRVDVYPGMPHVFWFKFRNHPACKLFYKDTVAGLGWLLHLA
ncbi:unnamed protein product [Clonostachys rosea]|uniref:Alpha/beta hydrolase fold-3 domain-containing protein n=1 Tax=Bionectria ochroleuca TaxID=29856 RepID=A0ABY6U8J1_BIOOC|nr:unnamed protein product [Clonostachys rosea]